MISGNDLYSLIVSIPERVWGGLEPLVKGSLSFGTLVSIPERVWGGLEPHR